MSKLPSEQPPVDNPTGLREWLSRMVVLINGAIDTIFDLDVLYQIPPSASEGAIRFFGDPAPSPIRYGGPWIFSNGEWRPMVSMYNNNSYVEGRVYNAQDTVWGVGWTMSSKINNNLDYPFPIATAPREALYVTTPAWDSPNPDFTGVVQSGMTIEFLQGGWFGGFQIWAPTLTANTNYVVKIFDITDPNNPEFQSIPEPLLNLDSWTIVVLTNTVVTVGTKFLIFLDVLNSGTSNDFSFQYTFGGSTQSITPGSGVWNNDNQDIIFRINKTDANSNDQTVPAQFIPNTTLVITSTVDVSRSITYEVLSGPADDGSSYSYTVALTGLGASGRPLFNELCDIDVSEPIPQNTDYVEFTNYWLTNTPVWASITGYLALNGVEQSVDDNGYGIDLSFTPGAVSENWSFVAYSPDIDSAQARINDSINGTSVLNPTGLEGFELTDQKPLVVDTPLQIKFGGAQGTGADPIQLLADGTVQCNESGDYDINVVLNTSRDNAAMNAKLLFHVEENGVISQSTGLISLSLPGDFFPYRFSTTYEMTAGDLVRFFISRDSAGPNDGGLYLFTPANVSLNEVPSAGIRITKWELQA